jgi:hypothetical protein
VWAHFREQVGGGWFKAILASDGVGTELRTDRRPAIFGNADSAEQENVVVVVGDVFVVSAFGVGGTGKQH